MWNEYLLPATLQETLQVLDEKRESVRIVAGATDLMLELERGARKGVETLVDITRLPGLDYITLSPDGTVHLGPLVTHNKAASSRLLRDHAFPLVSAAWQVGAPQIRNRATVAGNLVTASPANDTITPLMAMGAWVTLASRKTTRQVPLVEFYTGVRKTVLQPDEMLVDIAFPAMSKTQRGTFLKLGLRRAQAISVVNVAILLNLEMGRVSSVAITLGSVAPTIIHAPESETYLVGKELTGEVIVHTGELAAASARPIDDIRASAAYRQAMVRALIVRGLHLIRSGEWLSQVPEEPVQLSTIETRSSLSPTSPYSSHISLPSIHAKINGKEFVFQTGSNKSLLRLLREEAGMTGTKEGCAEGECGACTVFLDGKAVMACLVPAPSVDGAEIVTIEGLSSRSEKEPRGIKLHPVQEAFIRDGAVQCGYCTPGFIMSAAKLLEERPLPSRSEITQALTGNLCRCTGYYKIIQAVENAAKRSD